MYVCTVCMSDRQDIRKITHISIFIHGIAGGGLFRLTWRLSVFHFACRATSRGAHPRTEATSAALLEYSPISVNIE